MRINRKIGYARVSKHDQHLKLQIDALLNYGCREGEIFTDHISGAKAERPGLEKCLQELQKGDTLVVWRLDRLGRSMPHLVSTVEDLKNRGISFKSLCDGAIDTTTASGELVFNIFSSLAQFERKLIQERTKAGLNAARARGRNGGRKRTLSTDPKVLTARKMHKDHNMDIDNICKMLKISRATFYRYLSLDK
ncbi:recombinase family protein [Rickettsiales endosymbiont of Peranema trichophorum]|uniref:recombinase family protein n=1 Tax=Rickettsiales endosymbiont of Peranema trichophorum TaxID=2486577 RepID=UPI001023C8A6|nr:recombinase family protein [Rickettsiales endosymbiont of Peranema trichophorum]RZI45460.1 recombinase family protein [Rickettsiales endosymbiont of Peranema trichophorum]